MPARANECPGSYVDFATGCANVRADARAEVHRFRSRAPDRTRFARLHRPLRSGTGTLARRKIELFSRLDTVQIGVDLILKAIDLHRLNAISFWDALIVRAALDGGCSVLFSEDLHAGQRIEGLRVVNPFAG